MWKGIQSFRGWGKKFGTVLTREADAARRLPVRHLLLLLALLVRGLRAIASIL